MVVLKNCVRSICATVWRDVTERTRQKNRVIGRKRICGAQFTFSEKGKNCSKKITSFEIYTRPDDT